MSDTKPESKTTRPAWMLVCRADGAPLYWVAADGTRRAPGDPPPRSEWSAEMCCSGCPDPQNCIDHGALCSG